MTIDTENQAKGCDGLKEYGKKLAYLGDLLQQDNASVQELATAAHDCGLTVQFRLVPVDSDDGGAELDEGAEQ